VIVDNLFNVPDFVGIVKVEERLLILLAIVKNSIILGGNDKDCLTLVNGEELRLLGQAHIESHNIEHLFCFCVQHDN
jgi:hypothetical protein